MDTLMHADVFFFVTTIAVGVVTIAIAVVAFYLIGVLRRVRDIADDVKRETALFREDIRNARMRVKAGGLRVVHLFDFFGNKSEKKRKKSNETS